MRHSKLLGSWLRGGNPQVFTLMMLSAGFVILVRLCYPILMRWDLSIQVEAAERLVQGLGLTNAFSPQLDLAQPPLSETLIHFPPALSLLVAVFLYLHIPLVVALKIIYSLATLIGWLGWAAIAAHSLSDPIRLKLFSWRGSFPGHLILAIALPLFHTPSWPGTDLILWAIIPIVTWLLLLPMRQPRSTPATALAAILILVATATRYASAFLLLAALPIIVYGEWPSFRAACKRLTIFYGTFFGILLPPFAIYKILIAPSTSDNVSLSSLLQTQGARFLSPDLLQTIFNSTRKVVFSLADLHHLFGFGSGVRIEALASTSTVANLLLGFGLLTLLIVLTRVILQADKNSPSFKGKIALALAALVIAHIVFAAALTFLIAYSPLTIPRYYYPIQSCLILILYTLATYRAVKPALSQGLALVLIFIVIIPNFALKPLYYIGSGQWERLATFDIIKIQQLGSPRSPHGLVSLHQPSLDILMELERQDPNTIFLVQHYPEYISYLNFKQPLNFRRIPDDSFWQNAYLSQPTKIVWVMNHPQCPSICASLGNFNSDNPNAEIPSLKDLPNLTTLYEPAANLEGLPMEAHRYAKIMVSDLPAGYRFGSTSTPVQQ